MLTEHYYLSEVDILVSDSQFLLFVVTSNLSKAVHFDKVFLGERDDHS